MCVCMCISVCVFVCVCLCVCMCVCLCVCFKALGLFRAQLKLAAISFGFVVLEMSAVIFSYSEKSHQSNPWPKSTNGFDFA